MSKHLAPCGMDCTACEAYTSTQSQDLETKKKLAESYQMNFGKEISFAELDCDGCHSKGRHIAFCSECVIRSCAFGKGYDTCAECESFPCAEGSFIWTESSQSRAALQQIRNSRV